MHLIFLYFYHIINAENENCKKDTFSIPSRNQNGAQSISLLGLFFIVYIATGNSVAQISAKFITSHPFSHLQQQLLSYLLSIHQQSFADASSFH